MPPTAAKQAVSVPGRRYQGGPRASPSAGNLLQSEAGAGPNNGPRDPASLPSSLTHPLSATHTKHNQVSSEPTPATSSTTT
ncbi:hypothetical protein VTO73DRAFT_5760 [Trametes versicolor]